MTVNLETTIESARFSELVSSIRSVVLDYAEPYVHSNRFSGAFGEVRMCVHRETGAQRAVKVLRKSHMDDDEKRMLFNEINILKEIVSKN